MVLCQHSCLMCAYILRILCTCISGAEVKRRNKFSTTVLVQERCYGELGCFSTGGDFGHRWVNLLPQDREKINTRFYLHTRKNVNVWDAEQLKAHDVKGLLGSTFNPKSLTKMIVHGFSDNSFKPWIEVNTLWIMCVRLLRVQHNTFE